MDCRRFEDFNELYAELSNLLNNNLEDLAQQFLQAINDPDIGMEYYRDGVKTVKCIAEFSNSLSMTERRVEKIFRMLYYTLRDDTESFKSDNRHVSEIWTYDCEYK